MFLGHGDGLAVEHEGDLDGVAGVGVRAVEDDLPPRHDLGPRGDRAAEQGPHLLVVRLGRGHGE